MLLYNRGRAVAYAHRWAFDRNPAWGAFDEMGGDCANFVSQCLFAGSGVMDETPGVGWYYYSLNRRAPAWSGVEELRRYLTRNDQRHGPYGAEAPLALAQPGDVILLQLDRDRFTHSGVVVSAAIPATPADVLIAAHTRDCDHRPIASYPYRQALLIHIKGVYAG